MPKQDKNRNTYYGKGKPDKGWEWQAGSNGKSRNIISPTRTPNEREAIRKKNERLDNSQAIQDNTLDKIHRQTNSAYKKFSYNKKK